MIKRLLPFLFSVLFFIPSFGQVYEPGLLVKSTGDTLRGEIENGFWDEPPRFIRFRPTPQSPSQLFEPRQLRAVSFTEGRFFRYEALPIDHAAETKLDKLPRGNYFDVRVDTVLAEVLLEGSVPLRRVVLDGIAHYLLRRPNQPVLELSERKYLRQTTDGAWSVTDGNNYLNLLSLYFVDCPEAASAVRSAPFTAEGLVGVIQAFDQACSPGGKPTRSWLDHAKPRRRLSFQGGVLAGVRYNRIESTSYQLAGSCVDCRARPFAGLYAELFQPSRTAAVYGELSLSSFHSKGTYAFDYNPQTGETIYRTYDYRALLGTARLGVRYFLPLGRENQLLIGLGYELNRILKTSVMPINGQVYRPSDDDEFGFGMPTLLPGLSLGWRNRRVTVSLDGKLYGSNDDDDSALGGAFLGSNFVVRTGLSYRLGRNPDAAQAPATAKP